MAFAVPSHALDDFGDQGFAVIEGAIKGSMLEMLRQEGDRFVRDTDAWLDARGVETMGITHRGKRYFISNRYRKSPVLWKFLFGPLMQEITTTFLGDEVYLFNEQWVVKGADQGMRFAWHQDSGYVKFLDPGTVHEPYLTCWCALDDMHQSNGTISVLPHQVVGSKNRIFDHTRESGTNDLVGYNGKEPGVQLTVPAGTVVVFSSTSLHRSGENSTGERRRAYLAQYTSHPLHHSNGNLWAQAVPFVRNGECVYDHSADFQGSA